MTETTPGRMLFP